MSDTSEYLTVAELAVLLRRSPRSLYRWRRDFYGPTAIRFKGQYLYRRDEVEQWRMDQFAHAVHQYAA
jgi:hypothetical protein